MSVYSFAFLLRDKKYDQAANRLVTILHITGGIETRAEYDDRLAPFCYLAWDLMSDYSIKLLYDSWYSIHCAARDKLRDHLSVIKKRRGLSSGFYYSADHNLIRLKTAKLLRRTAKQEILHNDAIYSILQFITVNECLYIAKNILFETPIIGY